MIDAGYIVEFIDKNQIVLALVQSAKKGRLALLSAQDKQLALPDGRVLLAHYSNLNPNAPRLTLTAVLAEMENKRQLLAQQVDVAELWELVHGEAQGLSLQQLAELAFRPPLGPEHASATLRAIFAERIHFRLNNKSCEALSPVQLEQKIIQQQKEEEKKARHELYLSSLQAGAPPPELAAMLIDWLAHEDDSVHARQVKELLGQSGFNSRQKVLDLLVGLGILRAHHNLAAVREQIAVEFSAQALDTANGVQVLEAGYPYLDLDLFTIDGVETDDFDDALSFVPRPDGTAQLGIHIASLEALAPASVLDMEARQRATTLYLPDERIPMLPPRLSTDAFSLRAGEVRPVLSCLVELSGQGQIIDYSIAPRLIKVQQRLTYEQVDQRLREGDNFFRQLHHITLLFNQQRAQAGACFLPLPEVVIQVDDDWQAHITIIDRDGPAREMVAETAILANRLQGAFMHKVGVRCLYRVQPPPKDPWENAEAEALFTNFSRRRLLQRVDLSLTPGLHSGLGIETYTHATSPIRRYLDLLVQRQLLAHLQGKPAPLDGAGLMAAAAQVDVNLRAANRVRAARQRYWQLKWLQQQQGQAIAALVLEKQLRSWQILLKPVMLLANVSLQGASKGLAVNQEIAVKVLRADPLEDVLRLELA